MEVSNDKEVMHTDAPAAHGGIGDFPTPVHMMAEALLACGVTTASMGAAKAGLDPTGWYAELTNIDFSETHDRVTAISAVFHFSKNVEEKDRKRLEAFTHRACTVGNSLSADKRFTFTYDV